MSVYIAYRDLVNYRFQMSLCGATNTGKFCMECGSVGPDF